MGWTTNFTGWVEQATGVKYRGDSPHAQTLANVNNNYPKFNGANRIIRQLPAYLGYDHISVSSINMGAEIYTTATTGEFPFALYASASNVTCVGSRTLTSEPIHPYEHLEHRWTISKSDGSPCEYGDEIVDPNSNNIINPYTDQIGGEAAFLLREEGEYTLQLTSIAPDGKTNYIRKTITVNVPTYQHAWYDGLNGNDANDGLDPWGFACTNATYTEATGTLTEVGKFTTYDHANATAVLSTDNFNWIYLGATYKWRRIVSKTDNDTIVLLDKLGSDQTGLTSSNGAKQTYVGGTADNTFIHLRGNQGTSVYTFTSKCLFNTYTLGLTDKRIGGYDDANVSVIADAGLVGNMFDFAGQAGGYYPTNLSIHNLNVDGGGTSGTITGAGLSDVDTGTSYAVLDRCVVLRSSTSTCISLQVQRAIKEHNILIWAIDIDNHKLVAEARRMALFTLVEDGHVAVIGGTLTGEADDPLQDHYWYPSEYTDHMCGRWIAFVDGINYNHCVNYNVKTGSNLNFITVADCYGDGSSWFTDMSDSNNTPGVSGVFNYSILRNTVRAANAFTIHYNGKQFTALDNIIIGGDRYMFYHGGPTKAGYIPAEFSYVASRNLTYGFGLDLDTYVSGVTCAREMTKNIVYDVNTTAEMMFIKVSQFDASVKYEGNNFYSPNDLDGLVILDDSVDISLAAFNAATGFTNTSTDPGWADPANGDFS